MKPTTRPKPYLRRGYEASKGNPDIREKLEDAQLRSLRVKIRDAERERAAVKDDELKSAEARQKTSRTKKTIRP